MIRLVLFSCLMVLGGTGCRRPESAPASVAGSEEYRDVLVRYLQAAADSTPGALEAASCDSATAAFTRRVLERAPWLRSAAPDSLRVVAMEHEGRDTVAMVVEWLGEDFTGAQFGVVMRSEGQRYLVCNLYMNSEL
jgi:hypothetical protein